jgi:hypothetical protein
VAAGIAAAVALLVLGLPAGEAWAALAPHVSYVGAADGFLGSYQPAVGADLAFVGVSLVAGALAGPLARVAGTRALGPRLASRVVEGGLAAGVAVGGFGAALLASRVGTLVRSDGLHRVLDQFRAEGGSPGALRVFASEVGFVVHAREVLVVLPLVALASYLLTAAARPAAAGTAARSPAAASSGSASSDSSQPEPDRVPGLSAAPPAAPPHGGAGAVPPPAG